MPPKAINRKIIEEKEKESKGKIASTEENIADKIDSLKSQVKELKQANDFLNKIDLKKDNISRLYAYLFKLSIINDGRKSIGVQIVQLRDDYFKLMNKFIDGSETPLSKIKKRSRNTINADITRSLFWFEDSCKILGVKNELFKNAGDIAKRILSMIELTDEKLSYTQGFDRYVFLMYALSLYFAMRADVDIQYAEALSFYLAKALIKLSDPNKILDDPLACDSFKKIDSLMEKHCPKTFAVLQHADQSSFHFAIRWRLILFCDEHDASATLLLWDNFLVHMDKIDEYFTYLACAHVIQVPITEPYMQVETIQRFRKWNNTKIIEDARVYSGDQATIALIKKRKIKKVSISLGLMMLVVAATASAVYYIYQSN